MNGSARGRDIVVISQFYWPEPCAAGNRVSSLARKLAAEGHRVTVLTGMPSFPAGEVAPAYRGMKTCTEMDGGVRVVRRRAYIVPKGAKGGRLRSWLSLALALSRTVLFELPRADTIVVSSPPITMAIPALLAAWRHRARLVVDVRDVFPDMGVRLGVWKERGLMARAVGGFVDVLYKRAAMIVAVTASARSSIRARGVESERLVLAPNGYEFSREPARRRERSEERSFEIAYAGNMGLATGLDVVLDAAKLLRDEPKIHFSLAGGGLDAARLTARIEDEGLRNVRFLGVLTREESLDLLATADATIIPLRSGLTDAIPSKMFDALAVGCPMIVSARGEAVRLLLESQSGVHVEPDDARALADGVLECRNNRKVLERRAIAGREFVRKNFDRDRIMEHLAQTIGAIA
jgi:glycosyltransferase involved in cell wall biosynthesis